MKFFKSIFIAGVLILSAGFFCKDSQAQMFWNQTCQFAGNSGSYIAVPNSSNLNITSHFSLEAWVNPASVSGTEKGIISKGSTLGASLRFAMKISTTGRVTLSTNGILRLTSTTSLTINNWTHVCGTYNATSGLFSIYYNGVLNTSAVVAGAAPASNTDSLFIGVAGAALPYSGQLDEVRIWNKELSSTEVSQYFRTSLGTSSGVYTLLALSLTFQNRHSGSPQFNLTDWSDGGNFAYGRNVTAVSQSDKPYNTIFNNECLNFDGTGDHLIGQSTTSVSPTNQMSVEAWVWPRAYANAPIIVSKNSATSYRLGLNASGKVQFSKDGGGVFTGKTSLSNGRWTHIAATFDAEQTKIYINGVLDTAGFPFFGVVGSNTDSLTIGCDNISGVTSNFFNGYIDEVRISKYAKSQQMLWDYLYRSIDSVNQPNAAFSNVCYNFDGGLTENADGGPKMFLRLDAKFSHPATINNVPVTPMNRADNYNFYEGYNMKTSGKRLPASGGTGSVDDSIYIPFNISISDINLFLGINHFDDANLDLFLIGPNGESLDFSTDNTMSVANDNVVTIFDDQADSSVLALRHTSFAPRIRPEKNFSSIFNGDLSQGTWILRVTDDGGNADTGRIYCWGIQFNNSVVPNRVTSLNLTMLMQGFYDAGSLIPDSARVYLRNTSSPYAITDSSKLVLNSSGNGVVSFINTGNASKYIVVKHRNSIETWSSSGVQFYLDSTTTYNFTTAANKAYGNNQALKAGKYCIYSGDVNQDGGVELTDMTLIENAAANFTVGYVPTDITGDNFVEITDQALADNNSFNYVGIMRP